MHINRILQITCLCLLTACNTLPVKPDPAAGSGTAINRQAEAQTLASKNAADEKELDKIVCRTEAPVGSRIGTRICMTRRRWIELQRQSQKALEDANRKSVTSQIPLSIDRQRNGH